MDKVDKVVAIFMLRQDFILQTPGSLTADVASEDLEFPKDFVVAARRIGERLQMQAREYLDRAAEWEAI